ncbi:MAG: hypothetical protein FJY67_06710 [Calditrichaeota bacterium]|nr:hypothetical protein [Calditrichota bacterium]
MQITKEDVKKRTILGKIGELEAYSLLARAGFKSIVNLNDANMNQEFADFLAERDGTKYVISVKARNKWERVTSRYPKPRINSRYKLGQNPEVAQMHARNAAQKFDAVPAWLVLAVEEDSYEAYFGTVSLLQDLGLNAGGVNMSPKYTAKYECLAIGQSHNYVFNTFWNEAPSGD